MMAFGTPYAMYGCQDYRAPQNELAISSDEDSDNEIDDDQGHSSLLNFSFGENDSDVDLSNDIYSSSLQGNRYQRPSSIRRSLHDGERGGPFSIVSDNDDDEDDDGDVDDDGDDDDGDDEDDDGEDDEDDDGGPRSGANEYDEYDEENCLGRRITRVSTAYSAAGSQVSSSVVNRKKTAKMYLLNYLGDRGFLRPKLLSSKNGVTFHVATSGDTVFLPTLSPTDDEYLNHLSRLNDDIPAPETSSGPLATNDPTETFRPELFHRESQSTISGLTRNQPNRTGTTESEVSPNVTQSTEESGNSNSISLQATDSNTTVDNSSNNTESENVPYNVAVIMSIKKTMELSSVKSELYSRIRVYWSNGLPPDKLETEEYYTGGQLSWEFTNNNYNLYVGISAPDQDMVIIENTQDLCKSKNFKNMHDFRDSAYLKKQKSKDLFLNDVSEASEKHSYTFQPGDYVFIVPIVFCNNIPETIYLPSARVNYHFRCGVKVIKSGTTGNTDNDTTKTNNNNDSGLSSTDANSVSALQSQSDSYDDSNAPSSAGDSTTGHFKFGRSKLFSKMKKQLHLPSRRGLSKSDCQRMIYSRMVLNLVRTPPLRSISTADKPIYINRVWTGSLSYEISFGQKYVPLGAEVPLKLKLVPLVKHISVKRIRICVVEKITYVSKNLEYEFDQVEVVANDPYSPYYPEFTSRRKPERILPLLEIRTRDKGGRAMKEEVVENCKSDNLLSYSTFKDPDSNSNVDLVEALTIDTKIRFPKYKVLSNKSARSVPPYGIDEFTQQDYVKSSATSRRGSTASGVIDFFAGKKSRKNSSISANLELPKGFTKFRTNSDLPVLNHTRLNEPKRGLYASSVNFSHINVKHKLEIMLRISKPDAEDPTKQRHFEVLIDTPVHVVSELCTTDNLELPTYAMATMSHSEQGHNINFQEPLPSFEQAISVPNSPRMSPIGSPQLRASYDPEELSIQQTMLSRASTQNNDDTSAALSRRYSNIDEMMGQNASAPARTTNSVPTVSFKESFLSHGMRTVSSVDESLNSDSEDEEAVLSEDEPPTYEEITPLM